MTISQVKNKIQAFLNNLRDKETKRYQHMIDKHAKNNFDNWTGHDSTKEVSYLLIKQHLDNMLANNESVKYQPTHPINWQRFDPNNPPNDKNAKYLIESNQGFMMIATRDFDEHFNSNECLYHFDKVKAYAIVNPSNF